MQANLAPIDPYTLTDNVFRLIGDDCFLLTAGTPERWNTMTAGWGGLGVLWKRKVAFVYVRPHRYTFEFINAAPGFTCSFFDPERKGVLDFCGSRSGRNVDKAAACGLTPVVSERGGIWFSEARLVLECRTIYRQDIDPALFLDTGLRDAIYPLKDWHRLYVGELTACLARPQRPGPATA